MKITILNNTNINITSDCQKVKEYFKFPIEFVEKKISIPVSVREYKVVQGFNRITGQPSPVRYYGIENSVKEACRTLSSGDIVIFVWNMDSVSLGNDSIVTSWTDGNPFGNTDFVQLAINQYIKDNDKIFKMLSHEILHALCFKANRNGYPTIDETDNTIVNGQIIPFYKNDDPSAVDGNYAHTLKNLKPFLDSLNKVGYKYFKPSEVVGLKPELVKMLDTARELSGTPFIITSGKRTQDNNAEVGGVSESSHLDGNAVDLSVVDSQKRFKILKSLLDVGFNRIGIYSKHIHCDISVDKPTGIIWYN